MSAAATGLVASYVALAVLLLSLNLRSGWRWPIKAAAIGVTAGFFVVAFLAVLGLLGWPTDAAPPDRFRLHAALVREPDRAGRSAGAIYLWLSPRGEDGEILASPRASAMPDSARADGNGPGATRGRPRGRGQDPAAIPLERAVHEPRRSHRAVRTAAPEPAPQGGLVAHSKRIFFIHLVREKQ
jgi:hypothetical protein